MPKYVSPDRIERDARDLRVLTNRDSELTRKERQENHELASEMEKLAISSRARSPYGPDSEHSWVQDRASLSLRIAPPDARERLNHHGQAVEDGNVQERAITTSTLGGIVPATIPPYVAEAVAYGVRSTAPLASALERLDLPPIGMNVSWAKVTTPLAVGVQTAQNNALTESDDAVSSTTDALQTIGGYVDFSAQGQELSGGWLDRVLGEELGRAFGAKLEQQIWAGTGSSGQITGFTVMSGNSASTVGTPNNLASTSSKIGDQYQQVTANLGALPDLVAMAPRRYAQLEAATAALGLPVENIFPGSMRGNIVVSPAAPTNLGGGTNEDWILLLNRAGTPLVRNPEPNIEFHREGPSAGLQLTFRWLIYAYVALGVSRRPESVGLVKGNTTPSL
jgi:HK97 family phage major capsid protein